MTKIEIPRLRHPTRAEFVERFLTPGLPVVIEGALDEWAALRKWSPAYFAQVVGEREVDVTTEEDGYFNKPRMPNRMRMADFVGTLERPTDKGVSYLKQQDFASLPELLPDVSLPPYAEAPMVLATNIWFGPGGTATPLHYDPFENLFAQIYGKKSFELVHPGDLGLTYLRALESDAPHISDVHCKSIDLERFPKFTDARRASIVLGSGDLLFLPAWWFHEVTSLETSISVNTWWRPKLERFTTPGAVRLAASGPLFLPPPFLLDQFEIEDPRGLPEHVEKLVIGGQSAAAVLFGGLFCTSKLMGLGAGAGIAPEFPAPSTPEAVAALLSSIVGATGIGEETAAMLRTWLGEVLSLRAEVGRTRDFSGVGSSGNAVTAQAMAAFLRSES